MFTKTQMNTKIGAVTRSATTLRDNVQAIVLSAAGYAFGNGDTQYFTKLRAGIVGVNVTKLDKFIEASFPVKFDKGSETYKVDKAAMKALRIERDVPNDRSIVCCVTACNISCKKVLLVRPLSLAPLSITTPLAWSTSLAPNAT